MKRLLFAALILLPVVLYAQAPDRDMLLTSAGTLYTIESLPTTDGSGTYLTLTINDGRSQTETAVPESLGDGYNSNPALAYDAESASLFVFWLRMPNMMSSELLLATLHDGKWQQAVSIDNKAFRLRYNLGIAVTRRVAQARSDGTEIDIPALVVHAVWWEQTGDSDAARYSMMVIEKGSVSTIEIHDLSEFAVTPDTAFNVDPKFNRNILKHPSFLDNGSSDSVDVLFGDLRTNSFNRVTIKPIAEGRIHIPIGHTGGSPIGAPRTFSADWPGRISAISSGRDGRLLLYNVSTDSVSYIVYANGTWSAAKSLSVNEKLSPDAAVSVLGRMMTSDQ